MAIGINWQVAGRKFRNTVNVIQKGLQTGGTVLTKVADVGGKVLDGIASVDPLLAANPIYAGARAAVAVTGTAGKVATQIANVKTAHQAGQAAGVAITSLRDAYNGTTPQPGVAPPGPGAEKVVDHAPPSPTTAADESF